MSRYNHHFANHFSSCVLLANARDPHRNRDVQLRLLPGEFDYVGVTDGVDAWIAPVAGDPFSVHIGRIIDNLRAGKPLQHVEAPRQRVLLALTPVETSAPPARKRIELPTAAPAVLLRRR